jgi:hypothetical protein
MGENVAWKLDGILNWEILGLIPNFEYLTDGVLKANIIPIYHNGMRCL